MVNQGKLRLCKTDPDYLSGINEELEGATSEEVLFWAWETFQPKIAATSSFQTQSVPLLHLISKVIPDLEILFLDTGFHFPETLAFRDKLKKQLGLRIRNLTNPSGHSNFLREHGELFRTNPDMCCYLNKVDPLKQAMKGRDAWISGIRRDQTKERSSVPVVSLRPDGTYKICPMLNWTSREIFEYLHDQNLPEHPKLKEGYLSIGCSPCTHPAAEEDERSGRWSGQTRTECGLHTDESN